MAVHWDEISGPSIISLYPSTELNDPESVALQIYLASVTVFGQHGSSQRTDFSVPLLSLGSEVTARVAFDSWPDDAIRGRERPFFIAFITKQAFNEKLDPHLDLFIYKYLDLLKEKKFNFDSKEVFDQVTEIYRPTLLDDAFDQTAFEVDSDYAISRAMVDLTTAKEAWIKLHDRNQLWTALRVANRLENVDDIATGEAFVLVGEIFLHSSNFQEAGEAFEKATDAFTRVRDFERSGEISALAGKCAYYLKDYERAINFLQTGVLWVKNNPSLLASINFDLATVLHEQERYEESYAHFDKASKLALDFNPRISGEYSAAYAGRLLVQAERLKEKDKSLMEGLIRRSANQRLATAQILKTHSFPRDAATSLVLAANAFFKVDESNRGVEALEEASTLFAEGEDYLSAAKTLYDGTRNIKDSPVDVYRLLMRAAMFLEKQGENPQNNRIHGSIKYELGKIEGQQGKIINAVKSLETALISFEKSNASPIERFSVTIQLANNFFRIEDFEQAAHHFFNASNFLNDVTPSDDSYQQKQKALVNALVSLRRSSTVYHHAGIIALQNSDESLASEMFTKSTSLLVEWFEKNPQTTDEVRKVVQDRIHTLTLKLDTFLLAESKHKINQNIELLAKLVH